MKNGFRTLLYSLLLLSIIGAGLYAQSGTDYAGFRSRYKPHQKKMDPKSKSVLVVQYLSGAELAAVLENYIQEGDKRMFTQLVCGVNRSLAAEAFQHMPTSSLIKGLNWLDNYWTLDLMWFTDEATFNRVAPSLKAFR
jgi:hypothetical protein